MSAWLGWVVVVADEKRREDEENGIDWERDGWPKDAPFMVCVRRTKIRYKKLKRFLFRLFS